jgi:hypothetical protein
MLILRFFGENSPIIIAASGAGPAVLKTGSQALVCQFLHEFYSFVEHPLDPPVCIKLY